MIVDLFGGPGGWAEGCRILGLDEIGLEWDEAACRTRAAAGHTVIRTDVARYPTAPFRGRITGLLASAPCQAWSRAGKQLGLLDQPLVHQAVTDLAAGRDTRAVLLPQCRDERSLLAAEPMRWLYDLRPLWIAMEEVPDVLPLWRQYAQVLRGWGYSVWTGILNAADYGVPQTRQRAILIASRVRQVSRPEPTHSEDGDEATLFGPARERWVSMARALGWTGPLAAGVVNTRGERTTPGGNEFSPARPSWALTEKTRSWVLHTNRDQRPDGTRQTRDLHTAPALTAKSGGQWVLRSGQSVAGEGRAERDLDEPAVTITVLADLCSWSLRVGTRANASVRPDSQAAPTLLFGHHCNEVSWVAVRPATTVAATDRIAKPGHRDRRGGQRQFEDSVRITVQEAAVLQSFRPDYPWQGTKTKKFEQIGNAWCPRAAAAVVGAAAGLDWTAAVEREYGAPDAGSAVAA